MYCHQLDKLDNVIKQKRLEVVNRKVVMFHHCNARPYTSLVTRKKLLQLGWDVLLHLPYLSNLALLDYHVCFILYKMP